MRTKPVIGIDLGGTNMQIGVVDGADRLIGRAKKKTRAAEGYRAVLDRLVEGVREACEDARITPKRLAAVGIGAPGAIDPSTGVVLQAPNLRWNNAPLARDLRKRLNVPIGLTNDVRAAALGEHAFGAGRGSRDMLAMWIGTGIGGGLILNNELYAGYFNAAGEIGHMTLLPGAPPGTRSFENICSRTAIVNRIVGLIRAGNRSIVTDLSDGDLSDVKAKIVAQAYAGNDAVTRLVVDDAARYMGLAAANLSSALSLERIVLGGGLTEAMGETLVALVRQAHRDAVYPFVNRKCRIVKTRLEDAAGIFGAALVARRSVAVSRAR